MLSWTVIVLNIITRVHLGIIIQNPRNHSSKILRIFTSSQMNEARITSSLRHLVKFHHIRQVASYYRDIHRQSLKNGSMQPLDARLYNTARKIFHFFPILTSRLPEIDLKHHITDY